jgi:hypothetical protein
MKPSTLVALALTLGSPVVASVVAPSAALADNKDPDKSPASDDIALTKGAVSYLQKKMADTTDWGTDAGKLESAKDALTSVTGGIQRIKKADPKWDVSDWEKLVKEAQARIQKADAAQSAKAAADTENEHAYRDYVAKLSGARDGMDLLADLEKKPEGVKIFSKDQIFGNMAKEIAKVSELDQGCRDKHWGSLTKIPSFYVKELPATEGCKRAAKWKELGKKFVELQAKGGAKNEATRIGNVIAKVKKGEPIEAADHKRFLGVDDYIKRFKEDYDKGGKAFDVTTDAAWFDAVKTAAGAYPAALTEAGKTSRWDKKATQVDAGTTQAVSKQHAKGGMMDEGKVVKAAAFDGWAVEKDLWNVPTSKSRSVDVLVQAKGETVCRLYHREASASFHGGAWSPVGVGGGESQFVISACK